MTVRDADRHFGDYYCRRCGQKLNWSKSKELTKVITVEITSISKVGDSDLIDIAKDDKNKTSFEDKLKQFLSADDVKVSKIQNFVINK